MLIVETVDDLSEDSENTDNEGKGEVGGNMLTRLSEKSNVVRQDTNNDTFEEYLDKSNSKDKEVYGSESANVFDGSILKRKSPAFSLEGSPFVKFTHCE